MSGYIKLIGIIN